MSDLNPKLSQEELVKIMSEPPEPELQAEIDAAHEKAAWLLPLAMKSLAEESDPQPKPRNKKRKKKSKR
jgi:hypothetical protein